MPEHLPLILTLYENKNIKKLPKKLAQKFPWKDISFTIYQLQQWKNHDLEHKVQRTNQQISITFALNNPCFVK